MAQDRLSDQLGDLGDDGVAEGFRSVHPVGNPISASNSEGCGHVPPKRAVRYVRSEACRWRFDQSEATGVGNNPYSVPPMIRPDGTSRNNKRCRGVAESVQVIEYGVEAEFNVAKNVLANDPSRPELS